MTCHKATCYDNNYNAYAWYTKQPTDKFIIAIMQTNMINISQGNVASPFGKWCYHVPSSQQGTIPSVSYQSDHMDMNVTWFCWREPI